MQTSHSSGTSRVAEADETTWRGVVLDANAKVRRCAGAGPAERHPGHSEPKFKAPPAPPPRSPGLIHRARTLLLRAASFAVERARARRRSARDERLVASFDDCKLRDIGIDPRTFRIDSTMTSWR
jgi:hypothetical protein